MSRHVPELGAQLTHHCHPPCPGPQAGVLWCGQVSPRGLEPWLLLSLGQRRAVWLLANTGPLSVSLLVRTTLAPGPSRVTVRPC